jgi:LAO/AO transport system kinase
VLDAAGKDWVVIETVGVGQDEVDIVRTADVAVVVLVPGTGDEVQALKAGIMEIADVFVVNKSDRDGADRLVASIEAMQALADPGPGEWRPPIVRTQATTGQGVAELLAAVEAFRAHAAPGRQERRRLRHAHRLRELLVERFMEHVDRRVLAPGEFDGLVARIADRGLDPYTAASGILEQALGRDERR